VVVVQILALGQVAIFAAGPVQAFFGAVKANKLRMQITVACAVVALILQIVLAPSFGITGVAVATTIGFALLLIVLLVVARRRFTAFELPALDGLLRAMVCVAAALAISGVPTLAARIAFALGGALIVFIFELSAVRSVARDLAVQESGGVRPNDAAPERR